MPKNTRNQVAVWLLLLSCWRGFAVDAPSPARPLTPEMRSLIAAQRIVLASMNRPQGRSTLAPLANPRMRRLLTQGWQLAGEWAGDWLDLHPDPTVQDLQHLFDAFTPPPHDPEVYDPAFPDRYSMAGYATRVTSDLFVVAADYQESQSAEAASTFFVVERQRGGRFVTEWSVKPLAQQHYPKKDEIGRWAFLGSCAYYCGPLVVQQIIALPPSHGRPRFAVDAYQATNGSTRLKQFSIWEWNGTAAKIVLINSYMLYVDDDREIQFANGRLLVPTKESTASFSSYGCCGEPRGTWTLQVTSDKVRDRGHIFLQPQILWADRLVSAVHSGRPAGANMASASVRHSLRHAEIDGEAIGKCDVQSSGDKGAFEIVFGSGAKLWLSYRLRNGLPYFTDVRVS